MLLLIGILIIIWEKFSPKIKEFYHIYIYICQILFIKRTIFHLSYYRFYFKTKKKKEIKKIYFSLI